MYNHTLISTHQYTSGWHISFLQNL